MEDILGWNFYVILAYALYITLLAYALYYTPASLDSVFYICVGIRSHLFGARFVYEFLSTFWKRVGSSSAPILRAFKIFLWMNCFDDFVDVVLIYF